MPTEEARPTVDATIIVHTYNHAPYISLCFKSILEQTTSRHLQIVWHDDASTDDTVNVGEKELRDCPHEIVRIHRKMNRMQRRVPFYLDIFEQCLGEYLFFLDGDDCWADPDKVDLQIDAMIAYPEQKVCFTPAILASGNEMKAEGVVGRHFDRRAIIALDSVIRGDGGFMPTPSLCFRRQVFETAPPWLYGYICCGDYPLQVLASSQAGALYLPDLTCIYRTNLPGSWTTKIGTQLEPRLTFEVELLELMLNLHKALPGNKDAFMAIALNHYGSLFSLSVSINDYRYVEKALLILKQFT